MCVKLYISIAIIESYIQQKIIHYYCYNVLSVYWVVALEFSPPKKSPPSPPPLAVIEVHT